MDASCYNFLQFQNEKKKKIQALDFAREMTFLCAPMVIKFGYYSSKANPKLTCQHLEQMGSSESRTK